MTEVRFYQLQKKRLDQALPEILQKAVERGQRAVVKAASRERVEALSLALWTYDPGSFLPHGHVRDGSEADQPVWLTDRDENPNGAALLVLVDGADAAGTTVGGFPLCCDVFDGNDQEALLAARARWKSCKDKGYSLSYFQQDEAGKWQKKE